MSQSVLADAIMLTNFDSEEQLNDWNRVRDRCKCDQKCVQKVDWRFWSGDLGGG